MNEDLQARIVELQQKVEKAARYKNLIDHEAGKLIACVKEAIILVERDPTAEERAKLISVINKYLANYMQRVGGSGTRSNIPNDIVKYFHDQYVEREAADEDSGADAG